eukprot:Lankesteria_metandrocarpae@DN357_c0_g1_i1.p1
MSADAATNTHTAACKAGVAQKAFNNLLSLPRSEWPTAVNKLPQATQRELLKLIAERDKSGKRSIAPSNDLHQNTGDQSEGLMRNRSKRHSTRGRGVAKLENSSKDDYSQHGTESLSCVVTDAVASSSPKCVEKTKKQSSLTDCTITTCSANAVAIVKSEQLTAADISRNNVTYNDCTVDTNSTPSMKEVGKRLRSGSRAWDSLSTVVTSELRDSSGTAYSTTATALLDAADMSIPDCVHCKEMVAHHMFVAGDSEFADEAACDAVYRYMIFWLVAIFQKIIESMCILTTIKLRRYHGRRKRPLASTWNIQEVTAMIRKLLVYMFPVELERYAARENIYKKVHERVQRQMSRSTETQPNDEQEDLFGSVDKNEDIDKLFKAVVIQQMLPGQTADILINPAERFERRMDLADVRTAAMAPVQYRRYCKSREAMFIKSRGGLQSLLSHCAAAAMINVRRAAAEGKHAVISGGEFGLPASKNSPLQVSRSLHRIFAFLMADKVATHVELALRIRKTRRDSNTKLTHITAGELPSFEELVSDIRRCTESPIASIFQEAGFASTWFATRTDAKHYNEAAVLMYKEIDRYTFQLHGDYTAIGLRPPDDQLIMNRLAEWSPSKKALKCRQNAAASQTPILDESCEERNVGTSEGEERCDTHTTNKEEYDTTVFEAICRESMTRFPDVPTPECPSDFGLFFYVASREHLTEGLREGSSVEHVVAKVRELYNYHKANRTKEYKDHLKLFAMFKQYGSTLRRVLTLQQYVDSLELGAPLGSRAKRCPSENHTRRAKLRKVEDQSVKQLSSSADDDDDLSLSSGDSSGDNEDEEECDNSDAIATN